MKFKVSFISFFIVMLAFCGQVYAGTYTGTLGSIQVDAYYLGDKVNVAVSDPGAIVSREACSTDGNYQFALDTSTNDGKTALAMLIAAKMGNKTVFIKGGKGCGVVSILETIRILRLL